MVKQESSPKVQKLRNNDNSKNKLSLKLMTTKINDSPLIDLYITPNIILFLPSLSYFFLLTFSLHCIATKPLMHCFVEVDRHSSLSHTIVEQAFPHCLVIFLLPYVVVLHSILLPYFTLLAPSYHSL